MLNSGTEANTPVTVDGSACDHVHELSSVTIDGQDFAPADGANCRDFSVDVDSRQGMTIVQGTATNSRGQIGSLSQSFLRSPTYFPASEVSDPNARASSGLYMGLGQEFLDDQDRADMDDLVSIINYALAQIDFDALIGVIKYADPDNNGDGEVDETSYSCGIWPVEWTEWNTRTGYRVRKTGPFTYSAIGVKLLEFVDGGMVIEVALANARASMDARAYLDVGCLGEQAVSLGASAHVPGEAVLRSTAAITLGPTGAPQISFGQTTMSAASPVIDIDLGVLDFVDFLANPILNSLSGMFNGMIAGAAAGAIEGVLNDVVPDMFTQLAFNETINLPAPFSTSVAVESAFDVINVGTDGARLGAYTQVRPTAPNPAHQGAPFGAISYGGAVPTLSLDPNSFQVAVKDDLVNQFLWATWLGGGFDIDDISQFVNPDELMGLDVTLHSTLPPVVMAGAGADQIDIGWGDIFVTATVLPVEVRSMIASAGKDEELQYPSEEPLVIALYLSAIIGGEIGTNSATNTFDATLSENPQVYLQVYSVSDPSQVDPGLITIVNSDVGKVLRESIPGMLESVLNSFPLPSINVGNISNLLPDVELKMSDADIERQGHYYLLGGDLENQ
jgi:hypothetical protein